MVRWAVRHAAFGRLCGATSIGKCRGHLPRRGADLVVWSYYPAPICCPGRPVGRRDEGRRPDGEDGDGR